MVTVVENRSVVKCDKCVQNVQSYIIMIHIHEVKGMLSTLIACKFDTDYITLFLHFTYLILDKQVEKVLNKDDDIAELIYIYT